MLLRVMPGVDVSEVSNEQLQGYIASSGPRTLSSAMSACSDAVDSTSSDSEQATALGACVSTTAKEELANVYGVLSEDITDEDVEEALELSAQYASRAASKACMQVSCCCCENQL